MTPNTKFEFKSLQATSGWGDVSYVPMPKPTRFDGVEKSLALRDAELDRLVREMLWKFPSIALLNNHASVLEDHASVLEDHLREGLRFATKNRLITARIPANPQESFRGTEQMRAYIGKEPIILVEDPRLEDGEWFLAHPGQVRAYEEGWFCEGGGGKSIVFGDGEGEDGPA